MNSLILPTCNSWLLNKLFSTDRLSSRKHFSRKTLLIELSKISSHHSCIKERLSKASKLAIALAEAQLLVTNLVQEASVKGTHRVITCLILKRAASRTLAKAIQLPLNGFQEIPKRSHRAVLRV